MAVNVKNLSTCEFELIKIIPSGINNQDFESLLEYFSSKTLTENPKDSALNRYRTRVDRMPANNLSLFNKGVVSANRHFDLELFDPVQYESFTYAEYHKDHFTEIHNDLCTTRYFKENTRKLTAILILSEPSEYDGGEFIIHGTDMLDELGIRHIKKLYSCKPNKGDIIVIPSFVFHEVMPIKSGIRKTLTGLVLGPRYK